MQTYTEWKLLNESLAGMGNMALGVARPTSLGGPVGSNLYEMGFDDEEDWEDDEELEDDEFDDEDEFGDDEDAEFEDDEEDTDLFGRESMGGPDGEFPPESASAEDDDMWGDDGAEFGGGLEDEGFDMDDMGVGDEGDFEDEEGFGDDDLEGEGEFDDMGDEGDFEDEEGFGDDDLEGEGEFDDMGDVEVGDDMDAEHGDFMDRMADYCGRYMADHMAKKSRKYMSKGGKKYMCGSGCEDEEKKDRKYMKKHGGKWSDNIHSREDMTNMQDNHFGKKGKKDMKSCMKREAVGTENETIEQFFATLSNNAKGDHQVRGWSGLSEEILLQAIAPNDPDVNHFASGSPNQPGFFEPQAGQPGYAPQGRVGSIGGGYTQDDIADINTMPY